MLAFSLRQKTFQVPCFKWQANLSFTVRNQQNFTSRLDVWQKNLHLDWTWVLHQTHQIKSHHVSQSVLRLTGSQKWDSQKLLGPEVTGNGLSYLHDDIQQIIYDDHVYTSISGRSYTIIMFLWHSLEDHLWSICEHRYAWSDHLWARRCEHGNLWARKCIFIGSLGHFFDGSLSFFFVGSCGFFCCISRFFLFDLVGFFLLDLMLFFLFDLLVFFFFLWLFFHWIW